jgi:hypothetical protein
MSLTFCIAYLASVYEALDWPVLDKNSLHQKMLASAKDHACLGPLGDKKSNIIISSRIIGHEKVKPSAGLSLL